VGEQADDDRGRDQERRGGERGLPHPSEVHVPEREIQQADPDRRADDQLEGLLHLDQIAGPRTGTRYSMSGALPASIPRLAPYLGAASSAGACGATASEVNFFTITVPGGAPLARRTCLRRVTWTSTFPDEPARLKCAASPAAYRSVLAGRWAIRAGLR